MQVTDDLFNKLSRLAMLRFTHLEKEEIKKDLEQIIIFFDKLSELDTTGVTPLVHMTSNVNVLREDLPGEMLSAQQALSNTPHKNSHYFKVPRVIKKPGQ
ncbi:MAG: Asp-tRNA(Asn)/Glu-tRNA(Gln) amidotransferase subunit GatC [Flavisolibacter sp.]